MEYPWYEVMEKSEDITQGDIIKACPVPILCNYVGSENKSILEAKIEVIDGIILTQACDIENRKVDNIILCSITSKEDFEKDLEKKGRTKREVQKTIESIIKGQQNSCHIINEYKDDNFEQDYYVINIKDIFSIPVELAKEIAKKEKKRLRLCPPYREHLSQAFARYFMRVGLPININI